jgi:hypothetical protein
MTSKIRGTGEMRDNRARSRLRCSRILTGVFDNKNIPKMTITSSQVFDEIAPLEQDFF